MNVFDLLNDETRPKAPPIPGATMADRTAGRRLALIHDMHLEALDETMDMMRQVEAGEARIEEFAEHLDTLEMTKNYAKFGNLYGRECKFSDFHHTAEDTTIFPVIYANGSDGMRRVIARLAEEHVVIHELLVKLAGHVAAIRARPGPETFSEAKATLLVLDQVVRSHFGYEQNQLEEAIGYYNAMP
jgi:iron-sulfur cluster repair protein YtfE (RIC family)